MQSLRELYKIGRGPSSSHTMGPERAMRIFRERYPEADRFVVTLFGSLALTGEGHGTDRVIRETVAPIPCEVIFDCEAECPVHPNTMEVKIYRGEVLLEQKKVYSVGGGTIRLEGEAEDACSKNARNDIYPLNTYSEIAEYCRERNIRLWQYVEECEGSDIFSYLSDIWEQMKAAVHEGLTTAGELPGGLHTQRRAQILYNQRHIDESAQTKENRLVCSYAFAVSGYRCSKTSCARLFI